MAAPEFEKQEPEFEASTPAVDSVRQRNFMITTLHETSAGKAAIQTITFKVRTCALGLVLVATTPQGICAILPGNDEKALVGQLRSIFPRAALLKDSKDTPQEIGEACAANALAVVIPCHSVIRSDGGLAGYRWGVNRKRLLLQREQEMFPDP